ncbi:hypothetical protein BG015_008508 [Linnemannia schmuckeri]|uniref:Arm-like repeat domain-containing protein n=1 Tax=Linnemannia schmuckeri TaxID=64567 RepID=A0A9P5SB56_9FUNG|nr:hypothetical protein BG015_008508 [Linnemannia schmuckeri]
MTFNNVSKPAIRTELPNKQQDRIVGNDQLVYCCSLLLHGSVTPSSTADSVDASQERILNKTEFEWLEEMKKDTTEQDHLRELAAEMAEEFVKDAFKTSDEIIEIVALGPILDREHYRKLLSCFISVFDDACILDVNFLQDFVQLVQSVSPGFLDAEDLVKSLSTIRTRMQSTYQQSTEHPYNLTLAVSRILDVMADHKVKDLDRIQENEPLSEVLSSLRGNSDPYFMYQACYALQALQYVPDNETPLQAVLRYSAGIGSSLMRVAGVVKLDLTPILEGLSSLQESLGSIVQIAGTVYDGVCSLMESGQGVFDSLKEGYASGKKRP